MQTKETTQVIEGYLEYVITRVMCKETWTSRQSQIYSIALVLMGYMIPLCFLALLYGKVGYILWHRRGVVNSLPERSIRRHQQQRKKRVALLLSLVISFALLWGPYFIIQCTDYFTTPQYNTEIFSYIHVLGHTNVALNPILYAVFHEKIRAEFVKICNRIIGK